MDMSEKVLRLKPAGMAAEEWATRLELAQSKRISNNHREPGGGRQAVERGSGEEGDHEQ